VHEKTEQKVQVYFECFSKKIALVFSSTGWWLIDCQTLYIVRKRKNLRLQAQKIREHKGTSEARTGAYKTDFLLKNAPKTLLLA